MKAKKGICSSDCECLTITWWRCYAEEHLCNCGDWGSTPPVPPTPVDTYEIIKSEETGGDSTLTTYSFYKRSQWWNEFIGMQGKTRNSSFQYALVSNDQEFDENLKTIASQSDYIEWATKFEQVIAWELDAAEVFQDFNTYYNGLSEKTFTYYIQKFDDTYGEYRNLTYNSSRSDDHYTDSYYITFIYVNNELDNIHMYWDNSSEWEREVTNTQDAETLAQHAEEALLDDTKKEWLFYEFRDLYNSLD